MTLPQWTGFVFERSENIVGRVENAGYKHFSALPKVFSKALFLVFNSLPNDKSLNLPNLKAFADNKINVI